MSHSALAPIGASALVTGAGSGIGQAVARCIGERGLHVFAANLDTRADATVAAITGKGGSATGIDVDVTDPAAITRLVTAMRPPAPPLRYVCLSAGATPKVAPFEQQDIATWTATFDVHVLGVVRLCQHVLGTLSELQVSIVTLGSLAGIRRPSHLAAYAAAKSAVTTLTRCLATEYEGQARLLNVCPGPTETPMWEEARRDGLVAAERPNTVEEVAGLVARCLLTDDYESGSVLAIEAGVVSEAFYQVGVECDA